jgi:hypothetical protein
MQEGEGLVREEEAAETLVRPINHRPITNRALRKKGGRIGLQIQACSTGMAAINRQVSFSWLNRAGKRAAYRQARGSDRGDRCLVWIM